jgi:hypothetical protein
MRLDIGPGGKIIGTKRVSPNGQVSGLSDYAGREVLVVLLEDGSGAGSESATAPTGWSEAVNEQMRRAFDQYQTLQDLYASPWEATRAFLHSVFPWAPVPSLTDQLNRWIESQVSPSSRNAPRPSESGGRSAENSPDSDHTKTSKTGSRKKKAAGRSAGARA